MGIFSGILGNASEVNVKEVQKELEPILIDGEEIDQAFKIIRDMIIFTNKRLILIDKQGMTGKKMDYLSIPYKSINRFSIETAGHLDLEAELKIWASSSIEPTITKEFKKDSNIYEVQKTLARHILK